MHADSITYVQITSESKVPEISSLAPFKAIVAIDDETIGDLRRAEMSEWLVESGCLYMMAWGAQCSDWDDSVDTANLEAHDFGEIPDKDFVMTTWHESEPLREVFEFSKLSASHPTERLGHTVLLHLAKVSKEEEFRREYARA